MWPPTWQFDPNRLHERQKPAISLEKTPKGVKKPCQRFATAQEGHYN